MWKHMFSPLDFDASAGNMWMAYKQFPPWFLHSAFLFSTTRNLCHHIIIIRNINKMCFIRFDRVPRLFDGFEWASNISLIIIMHFTWVAVYLSNSEPITDDIEVVWVIQYLMLQSTIKFAWYLVSRFFLSMKRIQLVHTWLLAYS